MSISPIRGAAVYHNDVVVFSLGVKNDLRHRFNKRDRLLTHLIRLLT